MTEFVEYYRRVWKDNMTRRPVKARVMMEEILGRKLNEGEVVHHIDGNKLNDAPDNLRLMTREEHFWEHVRRGDRKIFSNVHVGRNRIESKDPNLAWCGHCKQFLPRENFQKSKFTCNGLRNWCTKCRRSEKKHE